MRVAISKQLKRGAYDRRDGVARDASGLAVGRLEPVDKKLGTFARVTADAASGNVLARDDARVVDDVFP